MTSAPAGWYPNPANETEVRYWDGSQWTEHVHATAAQDTAGRDPEQTAPEKRKRRAPLWVVAVTGVTALLIGAGIGSAPSSEASDQRTISDLEEQLSASQEKTTDAQEALEETEQAHTDATAALTDERDSLADEVEELTRSVSDLTQKVSDEQAKAAEAQKRADEAESQVAAATPSAEPAPSEAAAPTNTYFQNCSAARAAGAAPVRSGDPGYGPHLDRDGDGVGCE